MRSGDILAPVHINSMYVKKSSLSVGDSPADSMELKFDINCTYSDLGFDKDAGEYALSTTLDVSAKLVNADDGQDIRAEAMVQVIAVVSAKKSEQLASEEAATQYLRLNGASMAYSHVRSQIMAMTSMSPMGMLTLPPINPGLLVEDSAGSSAAE